MFGNTNQPIDVRLWDAGYGSIVVSKSGQALDRSLIDASVWQPERADFAAEPVLEGDVIRHAPSAVLTEGAPCLATAGLLFERLDHLLSPAAVGVNPRRGTLLLPLMVKLQRQIKTRGFN